MQDERASWEVVEGKEATAHSRNGEHPEQVRDYLELPSPEHRHELVVRLWESTLSAKRSTYEETGRGTNFPRATWQART